MTASDTRAHLVEEKHFRISVLVGSPGPDGAAGNARVQRTCRSAAGVLQLKLPVVLADYDPTPPTAALKDLGRVLHANNIDSELPVHCTMARLAWASCETANHVLVVRSRCKRAPLHPDP